MSISRASQRQNHLVRQLLLIVHRINILPVVVRSKGHRHKYGNSSYYDKYFLQLLHTLLLKSLCAQLNIATIGRNQIGSRALASDVTNDID